MSSIKKVKSISQSNKDYPKSLEDHPFYGLQLDDEQKVFRDAIWSKDKDIIFCNARAGTGKTTIAMGVANLLVQYGRYKGICYIVSPTQEQRQGFLPGDVESKSAPYMEPLYDALVTLGIDPSRSVMSSDNIEGMKNGTAFIKCMTHTYLRGTNFEECVVILDETQNYYVDELKKVLTRIHDNCKVIVIGHSGQVDLYKNPNNSGFVPYINLFKGSERAFVCELTTNHRGWISTLADQLRV